ncbi:Serine-threonine protein kinase [Entamoeba marina]
MKTGSTMEQKRDKRTSFRLSDAFSRKSSSSKRADSTVSMKYEKPSTINNERHNTVTSPQKINVFGETPYNLPKEYCSFNGVPIIVEDCCHHIRDCIITSVRLIDKWDAATLSRFVSKNGGPSLTGITGEQAIQMDIHGFENLGMTEEVARNVFKAIAVEKAKAHALNDSINTNNYSCKELKDVYGLIKKYNDNKPVNLYQESTLKVSMYLLRTYFIMLDIPLFPKELCEKIDSILTPNDSSAEKRICELQQNIYEFIKMMIPTASYAIFEMMKDLFVQVGNHPRSIGLDMLNEFVIYFIESFNPTHTFERDYLEFLPMLLELCSEEINLQPKYRVETQNRYKGEIIKFCMDDALSPFFFNPPEFVEIKNTIGWFKGNFFITNYRALLVCNEDSMLYDTSYTQIPLNCITLTETTKETIQSTLYYVLKITTSDFRRISIFSLEPYPDTIQNMLEKHKSFYSTSFEEDQFTCLGILPRLTKQITKDELTRQHRKRQTKNTSTIWKHPTNKYELHVCLTGFTTDDNFISINPPSFSFSLILDAINESVGTPTPIVLVEKMTEFIKHVLDAANSITFKLKTGDTLVATDGFEQIKGILALSILSQDMYYYSIDGFMTFYRTFFKHSESFQRMIFLWGTALILNQFPHVFGFNYTFISTLFYHINSSRFSDELLSQYITYHKYSFVTHNKPSPYQLELVVPRPAALLFFSHISLNELPKMSKTNALMDGLNASSLPSFIPSTIQSFNLSKNMFFDIPLRLLSFTKISHLEISQNHIFVISNGLLKLNNLTYLDISSNQLKTFTYIGNNPLTSIPSLPMTLTSLGIQSLRCMPDLTKYSILKLDCSGTSAISTKTLIKSLSGTIETLNMSSRHMLSFPHKLSKLTALTSLDVSHNSFSVFPPSFFNMKLKELNIEHNPIKMLPPTFKNLQIETLLKTKFTGEFKSFEKKVIILDNSTELFNALIRHGKHANWTVREEARSAKLQMKNNIIIDVRVMTDDDFELQPHTAADALFIIRSNGHPCFRTTDLCLSVSLRHFIVVSEKSSDEPNTLYYDGTLQSMKSVCHSLRKSVEDLGKEDLPSMCYILLNSLQSYDISPSVMSSKLFNEVCNNIDLKSTETAKAIQFLAERKLIHYSLNTKSHTPRKEKRTHTAVNYIRATYSSYYSIKSDYVLVDMTDINHVAASIAMQPKCFLQDNPSILKYIISILEEYSVVINIRQELAEFIGCPSAFSVLNESAKKQTLLTRGVADVGDDIVLFSLTGASFQDDWKPRDNCIVTSREYRLNKFSFQLQHCLLASCALLLGVPIIIWRTGAVFHHKLNESLIEIKVNFTRESAQVHLRFEMSSPTIPVETGNLHRILETTLQTIISHYFLNISFTPHLLCPHCLKRSLLLTELPNPFSFDDGPHHYNFPLLCMDYFVACLPAPLPVPKIQREITQGSSSIIHLCDGDVVLKEVKSDYSTLSVEDATNDFSCRVQEIYREITFSQYNLPNVGKVLGYTLKPFGVVMDYYDAGSLFDLIETKTEIPITQILIDIANGMKHIHNINKLHRDLKSLNILLKGKGKTLKAFVCDFGESTNEGDEQSQVECPFWLAPEIFNGEKWSKDSDVFSFGVICWELVTKERPYEGKFYNEVKDFICSGKRLAIPDDSPYKKLISMCWSHNRTERPTFETILNMLKDL